MSLDSTVKTLFSGFIANLVLANFFHPCLGLDNPLNGLSKLNTDRVIFVNEDRSPFEVEHVTNVDGEDDDSQESDNNESADGEESENNSSIQNPDNDAVETSEDAGDVTGGGEGSDNDLNGGKKPGLEGYGEQEPSTSSIEDSTSDQALDLDETTDSEDSSSARQPEEILENPQLLAPPTVSKSKSELETKNLIKLVYVLQFGSLTDSIKLLELMVGNYPYDPDYRELLQAAKNLRHADIWYQYQRRLQLPPPSAKPKVIYKLIKMKRNEKPINELKQASWFHLIKGKSRLINSTN